jgi:SAM-dependent methyltransferase
VAEPSFVDALNRRTMASREAVTAYSRNEEVWPAERAVYDRVRAEVHGRPILDLGVGGGRTVPPLLELSEDYVGVDYTPAMVSACRRRFPRVRFEHGDARDLSRFPSGHFALVVFSCCGLGMVDHADRLRILAEVHRVLSPGAAFAFSVHNRRSPEYAEGFAFPAIEPTKDPLRRAVRAARFVVQTGRSLVNYLRNQKHEIRTSEYAIINDRCHEHATMLYYITLEEQRSQLVRAGFQAGAEAFDLEGKPATEASRDNAICLLART